MRLRNIFEALGNEVAIIFGRFNPPHKGHRAAWELASKSPIWYVGTNQSTVGPKDPLPFDVKVEAMKTIWPEVEGHIVAEQSWLTLASRVYEKNPNATLLCLTDEDWVTKTVMQYNGKEGPHGFYNFKRIEQKPTPRLSSATALRDAVSKGDREAFGQAAGVPADTPVAGKPFFDLVAEYLLPYQNAPKKVAKKKVAEASSMAQQAAIAINMKKNHKKPKNEAEGDPEGLPHLTKKLLTHIVQQVGTEGAHAIIKSLEWGDGASKELLHLIVNDLEKDIATTECAGVGIITKQNSTVDVNKGTPRKNLKAFRLVK